MCFLLLIVYFNNIRLLLLLCRIKENERFFVKLSC